MKASVLARTSHQLSAAVGDAHAHSANGGTGPYPAAFSQLGVLNVLSEKVTICAESSSGTSHREIRSLTPRLPKSAFSGWGLALVLVVALTGCAGSTAPDGGVSDADNPLYSLTLLRQGSLMLQQGRFDAALDKFEEADEISPGNATTLNMMGLCYMRLEQYDQALASFDQALARIPAFTDARNNRGATYLAMGQYRMAEVDFTAVLADSTYPHRFDVYYNLAMTYLQRGLTAAAKENFRNALDPNQPVFEAYLQLAKLEQEEGSPEDAVLLLEEAILSFPSRIEAPLALGRLLVILGRDQEAEPYLRRVVTDQPGSEFSDEARRLLGEK